METTPEQYALWATGRRAEVVQAKAQRAAERKARRQTEKAQLAKERYALRLEQDAIREHEWDDYLQRLADAERAKRVTRDTALGTYVEHREWGRVKIVKHSLRYDKVLVQVPEAVYWAHPRDSECFRRGNEFFRATWWNDLSSIQESMP